MAVTVDIALRALVNDALKSIQSFTKDASRSAAAVEKSFDSLGSVAKAAVGFLAFREVVGGITSVIHAASEQEDAINELSAAMEASGKFTQGATQRFAEFASSIQESTKFSDDAVLKAGALIESLTNLDEKGLKQATKASTDLAAVLNVDLGTAASLVAKAIEGNEGALKRYGLSVREGKTATENLANVLQALNDKGFSGRAENQINTYSGAVAQASNIFGEILETFGDFIIKNELVIKTIQVAKQTFSQFNNAISSNNESFNVLVNNGMRLVLDSFPVLIKFIEISDFLFTGFVNTLLRVEKGVKFFSGMAASLFETEDAIRGIAGAVKEDNAALDKQIALNNKSGESRRASLALVSDNISKVIKKIHEQNSSESKGTEDFVRGGSRRIASLQEVSKEQLQALESLKKNLENVGLTQIQVIDKEKNKRLELVQTTVRNSAESAELISKIELDAATKTAEAKKKINDKLNEDAEKAAKATNDKIVAIANQIASAVSAISSVAGTIEDVQDFQNNIPKALGDLENGLRSAGAQQIKDLRDQQQQQVDALKELQDAQLKNDLEILQNSKELEKKALQQQFDQGLLTAQELSDKTKQLEIEVEKKVAEAKFKSAQDLEEKILKLKIEQEKKLADARAKIESDITKKLVEERFKLEQELEEKKKKLSEDNAKAASKLFGDGLGAVANTLVPGIGGAVSSIIVGLVDNSKFIGEAFKSVLAEIPNVLLKLFDGVSNVLFAVIDAAPAFVAGLIEKLPEIAGKLGDIFSKLASVLPEAAIHFAIDLVKNAPKIGLSIAKAIAEGLINFIIGGFEGIINGFIDILNELPFVDIDHVQLGRVKFAEGGKVPAGFNNDNFPASLSSGEIVIPRDDTERLSRFLDRQESGSTTGGITPDQLQSILNQFDKSSNKNLTINVKVSDKQLAQAILDINRQGFRTA